MEELSPTPPVAIPAESAPAIPGVEATPVAEAAPTAILTGMPPPDGMLEWVLLSAGAALFLLYAVSLILISISGVLEGRLIQALRRNTVPDMLARIQAAREGNFALRMSLKIRGAEAAHQFFRDSLRAALPRVLSTRRRALLRHIIKEPTAEALIDQAYLQANRPKFRALLPDALDHRLRFYAARGDGAEAMRCALVSHDLFQEEGVGYVRGVLLTAGLKQADSDLVAGLGLGPGEPNSPQPPAEPTFVVDPVVARNVVQSLEAAHAAWRAHLETEGNDAEEVDEQVADAAQTNKFKDLQAALGQAIGAVADAANHLILCADEGVQKRAQAALSTALPALDDLAVLTPAVLLRLGMVFNALELEAQAREKDTLENRGPGNYFEALLEAGGTPEPASEPHPEGRSVPDADSDADSGSELVQGSDGDGDRNTDADGKADGDEPSGGQTGPEQLAAIMASASSILSDRMAGKEGVVPPIIQAQVEAMGRAADPSASPRPSLAAPASLLVVQATQKTTDQPAGDTRDPRGAGLAG